MAKKDLDPKAKKEIGDVFRKWRDEAEDLRQAIEKVHTENLTEEDTTFLDEIYRVCDEVTETFDELTE